MLESGQTQPQTQQAQGQQGQVTTRGDNWRNRMLAGRGFKVDVSETPKNYIVRADLPGVDKKDVKIEMWAFLEGSDVIWLKWTDLFSFFCLWIDSSDDEEYMTIQAEKREEKKEDNESRHIVERCVQFSPSVPTPEN